MNEEPAFSMIWPFNDGLTFRQIRLEHGFNNALKEMEKFKVKETKRLIIDMIQERGD